MRIPRLYVNQSLSVNTELTLDAEPSHYITRVLRLRPSATLRVFDGLGNEFAAELLNADKRAASIRISERLDYNAESPLAIELGIALSRGERMDWVVQKATELGAHSLTPLLTERIEVKLDETRLAKRHAHWQKIMIGACEQCGRNRLMTLNMPVALDSWLENTQANIKWVLHPGKTRLQTDIAPQSIALMVGPEGGLTEKEVTAAEAAGFSAAALGPRVLRTETAPVAALSLLQYLWGDF